MKDRIVQWARYVLFRGEARRVKGAGPQGLGGAGSREAGLHSTARALRSVPSAGQTACSVRVPSHAVGAATMRQGTVLRDFAFAVSKDRTGDWSELHPAPNAEASEDTGFSNRNGNDDGCGAMGTHACPCAAHRGGGISWGAYFAWEIWRFKLTAKFTTQILGSPQNFPRLLPQITTNFSSAPLAPLCSFTPGLFFFRKECWLQVVVVVGGGGGCTNRGLYACQCLLLPFPIAFLEKVAQCQWTLCFFVGQKFHLQPGTCFSWHVCTLCLAPSPWNASWLEKVLCRVQCSIWFST